MERLEEGRRVDGQLSARFCEGKTGKVEDKWQVRMTMHDNAQEVITSRGDGPIKQSEATVTGSEEKGRERKRVGERALIRGIIEQIHEIHRGKYRVRSKRDSVGRETCVLGYAYLPAK